MANLVALDLGTTAARAIWLRGRPGSLEVALALRVDWAGDAPVAALVAQMRSQKAPLGSVVLGIPGRAATLRYNLLPPVPEWRLELILKYETQELEEKSGESLGNDYRRLDIPDSGGDDQILLMGIGKNALIQKRIEEVEQGGGRVRCAVPAAFALFHAYRACRAGAPEETVLLADIGAEETHIVLVREGRLLFARSVNFGGNQIDEAIAQGLGIKAESARRLKEGIGDGKTPQHLAASAGNTIRAGLGQLSSVLQSSVTFCRTQVKLQDLKLDRVLVSGGSTRLPQLRTYLEETFRRPVELFRPAVGGTLPGPPEEWAIAIGLAATQLDREQFYLDLLPPAAKTRRDFRERTIFLGGAAAAALLSVTVYFAAGFLANSAVAEDSERLAEDQRTVAKHEGERARADEENQRIQARIDRLHRETLLTRFSAQVLYALEHHVPPALAVEKFAVMRKEQGGVLELEVSIEGKADDSDRKAIAHFKDFKAALENLPLVARLVPRIDDVQQGFRSFRIVLSPDKEAPKAPAATGRRP